MSALLVLAGITAVLFRGKTFSPFLFATDSDEMIKSFRGTVQVLDYLQHYVVDAGDDGSYSVERISRGLLVIHSGEHHYRLEATPVCIIVSDGAGEEVEI